MRGLEAPHPPRHPSSWFAKLPLLSPKRPSPLFSLLSNCLLSLPPPPLLSLPWLSLALDLSLHQLSYAHLSLPPLIFPSSPSQEKWVHDFFDLSTLILDVCNALSADVSDIDQAHLLIRHALHTLADPTAGFNNADQLDRAATSLREWIDTIQPTQPRKEELLQEPKTDPRTVNLLRNMFRGLAAPKEKSFLKGKGFLCVLYGAYATAVSIFSVLALALSREGELLSISLPPPNEISWFASMFDLLQRATQEAKRHPTSTGRYLDELHLLKESVTQLLNKLDSLRAEGNPPLTEQQAEELKGDIQALSKLVEVVTGGLDSVGRKLSEIFHAVVASRSALLDQLGSFGTRDDM